MELGHGVLHSVASSCSQFRNSLFTISSNIVQLNPLKLGSQSSTTVTSLVNFRNGNFAPEYYHTPSLNSARGLRWRRETEAVRGTSSIIPGAKGAIGALGSRGLDVLKPRLHCGVCKLKVDSDKDFPTEQEESRIADEESEAEGFNVAQWACWTVAAVYVGWLFILPYAPGDPVWAISPSTIQMLIDLSLNFYFVLPLTSILAKFAGFHELGAPVEHPMAEGLFNLVLGWTLLFAPLLFTDRKRDRFGGSLEALFIIQMFLTNTVLAPYMAIRLNRLGVRAKGSLSSQPFGINLDGVSKGMTQGAYAVGVTGGLVGIISVVWALFGRPEGGFGSFIDRWNYFLQYVGSERLAYAFIWDMVLYTFFQPWLIGDNLDNVRTDMRDLVRFLRFVPYLGLLAYVLGLQQELKSKV